MSTDPDLIKGIIAGDSRSFEVFYKKYFTALCLFANSRVRDSELGREVVQEVFLSLWKNREKLVIHESAKSYLYRAVINRIINHFKHQKVEAAYLESLEKDRTESNQADQFELEEKLFRLIDDLPPRRKEVFTLSRFEGLRYKEIAGRLNISLKTVEGQMSQALKFLEENLQEYLPVFILSLLQGWG